MSTAATQPTTDLDTDISACGRSGAPAGPYHSVTSSPSCSTTYASVKVSAKTSPAVPAEPSRRVTGSPHRSGPAAEGGQTSPVAEAGSARATPSPRDTK
jgi:hypothetical protein